MQYNFWKVCVIMINQIENLLNSEFPHELVKKIIEIYYKSICEYRKKNWQYFGNELGRFIEIAVRMVESKTEGTYKKLEEKLPIFNESRLKNFEQSVLSDNISYRILIPRQLYSMYTIRNKRGMIHINEIDPNYMDATLLLNMEKWVLAEFIRNSTKLNYEESLKLIEGIMTKENIVVWVEEDIFRILDNKISLEERILCILYYKNNINERDLFKLAEYSNISIFRKKLITMHKEQKINYSASKVTISPIGTNIAENILNSLANK